MFKVTLTPFGNIVPRHLVNDKKKSIIYFILFFISSISNAKIENNIILKVENEIITNYDIKNKILRT